MFRRRLLEDTVSRCYRSNVEMEIAYSTILNSVGNARGYDDNGLLAQMLNDVTACKEKMASACKSLAVVYAHQYKRSCQNGTQPETKENPLSAVRETNLRRAVDQSKMTYESLLETYDLMLRSLGVVSSRDDIEMLFQALKGVEECKDRFLAVSTMLSEINERLEQTYLEALYAPPPFFIDD